MSEASDSPRDLADAQAAWSQLCAVERLTVTVIVDNETDGLSSPCACCDPFLDSSTSTPYQSEFTWGVHQVASGRWPSLDFRRSLLAGHGLSLHISATTADGAVHQLLFDGGPREDLWQGNAERLGVDMAEVGGAVLSHWHVDHSVGLLAVARAASEARSRPTRGSVGATGSGGPADGCGGTPAATAAASSREPGPRETQDESQPHPPPPPGPQPQPFVFDLHPTRPARRGLLLGPKADKAVPFNEDPTPEQLSLPGCLVELHAGPHTLLKDCFFVSGAIPRRTSFETGQPGHATMEADGSWHLDPHIMEERYVAVRVRGRGVVVFSGCSHAGIVNVVTHVAEVSSGETIFGVMGGLHLAGGKMEGRIPQTVEALKQLNPQRVFGGHCTGWRAKAALIAAFPDRFQPMSVGGTYTFLAGPQGAEGGAGAGGDSGARDG
ncbi:hypothetical protein PLESTB_000187100 [Pleodorina starrii]|uniref:Metallo-beta-lactamase domain-containing protein n=1 Tax=Pleodorina starrii TaxID=330485 RepID=A0A9W6BBT0_9CHLO|nr:hypothetical protein PLESTM_000344100 [Pleodorina starrii]GLC49144.1 hypothetical protein PLESTB_000187100 [Pleodorina starrii]GLC73599.1 hypothetical protein PLESTF_001395500 [Pleodorina starrii]